MLKKANIQWSAKQLTKSIEKGTINFDNAVQRSYVWDNKRKSLLIHSMLTGYPIPAFFATKDENGYGMLDGKQRSNAISTYINNQYKLEDMPEVELESGETVEINGLLFSDLSEELQDRIKDYSLTIYYYENITEEEINELFYRLNNGKPLSSIELTRVKAKSLDTIKELGRHDIFRSTLTGKALSRYTNEDIVIKSWALLNGDSLCLETKCIRPLIEQADITDEQAEQIKVIFNKVFEAYTTLINSETKQHNKIAKRIITRTHFISIIPLVNKLINSGMWNEKQFVNWTKYFFNGKKSATISELYNESARNGSGKSDNVRRRLDEIESSYSSFVEMVA